MNSNLPEFTSFSVMEMHVPSGSIETILASRKPDGEISTRTFIEQDLDGRVISAMKPVGWEEKAPATSKLRGSAAGMKSSFFKNYWVSWNEGASLSALAITQENPIKVGGMADDLLIHPPVLGWDTKLRQYLVRTEGSRYSLWVHEFSGEIKTPGSVATRKIIDLPQKPLFPMAHPVPVNAGKNFEAKGEAVIAWLTAGGREMRVHALWIEGGKADRMDSDPISEYLPFPSQRIDAWAHFDGQVRVGWLMGRVDQDSIRAAEWICARGKMPGNLIVREHAVDGTKIQSAATVLIRRLDFGKGHNLLLTKSGRLFHSQNGAPYRGVRSDLSLSYDFPVFASFDQAYEARLDGKGDITLEAFR